MPALLPNHADLLVRTGARPLARSMRALPTGYAGAFNRRHYRVGHLFQNRYKSVVIGAEPSLLELTRYIHLNPLRTGMVRDLAALDKYPWTGHSGLLDWRQRPWEAVDEVQGHFAKTRGLARPRYRAFVAEGLGRIAYLWIEGLGRPGRPLVAALGVCPQSICAAAARGRVARAHWDRVLNN